MAAAELSEGSIVGMNEGRRASETTMTFTNHQGMNELKQCKNEWMARLEDNDADFQDIFDAHDDMLQRFQLSTFTKSAMNVLAKDRHARSAAAASPSTPPARPFISTATGEVVVRRRPHTIEPIPTHRLKTMTSGMSPNSTLTGALAGTGSTQNSLMQYTGRATGSQPQQDLMVVTGKVDYKKLKEEQKTLNAKTQQADVQYREMMDRFDDFNAQVERRFSFMLQESHSVLAPLPMAQEARVLVKVPDNVYKKMEPSAAGVASAEMF